jgi:lipid-A-disaccharide synthase
VLFRFEEAILNREVIRGRWVGHPCGALGPDPGRGAEARRALDVEPGEILLALLPGSRHAEVRRHLGPMLDAASRLAAAAGPRVRVAVSDAGPVEDAASRGDAASLWKLLSPIHVRGEAEDLVRAADLAIVASGTATLECASLGVPMVIVYKTSRLNFEIARRVVRLPRIGLANIVAGSDVAPELIQDAVTGPRIAEAAGRLLADPEAASRQRAGFARLADLLGGAGSAERAADALLDFVRARPEAPSPAG